MNATENDLAKNLDSSLTTEFQPLRRPLSLRSTEKKVTLTDQWTMLEKIDRELRERIRKERQQIIAQFDRDVVELNNAYTEKIENTIAMLEQDKKNELRELTDKTAQKLQEHDLLSKRMSN